MLNNLEIKYNILIIWNRITNYNLSMRSTFNSWSFLFNKLLIEMEMIILGYFLRIKN